MKILVTGATGFLGRHLTKKLQSLGAQISISNSKIASLNAIENLFVYNDIKFDYIFHLAAKTKAGDYCLYHAGEQWIDNQTINTNMLSYWKNYQPQAKMIAMGTSCSYSEEYLSDMREDNYLLGEPEKSLYTYAMTKRMLLIGLRSLQQQYGLKWLYFVPSTLYGPDFEMDDSHFIFDLIKKIYAAKNKISKEVELWGDGYQKRELIYVDDAIDIMIKLLRADNEIYNLGSGSDHSIREYASIVSNEFNYDEVRIKYNIDKYVGVRSKRLDPTKTIKDLGEYIFTPIRKGVHETVKYYKLKKSI